MRILVLDDDNGARVALRALLQANGHTVFLFESCDDVINTLVAGHRYDAILMDMWMPTHGGHGMRCYSRVKDISPVQAERIVFVTGGGLPLVMEKFLESKAWIEKPIDWNLLKAALEKIPTM
jgi:DNA-binding NtrC family response regulator